jgi:hypothetical protein
VSTSRLPVHFNVTLHSLKCDIISVASQDLLGNHHTRDHRSRFGPCEYERCQLSSIARHDTAATGPRDAQCSSEY